MGLITNIMKGFKAAPKTNGSPLPMVNYVSNAYGLGSFFNTRRNRKYLEEYTGWVYACTNVISDSVGDIEFTLKSGSDKDAKTIESHPILDLLYKANPYMSKFDLFKTTQAFLDLEGNAFWYLVKDGSGKPVAVWPLRPDMVTVVPSKESFVGGYIYRVGSEKYSIPADEMLHFKNFNPVDPYRGLGTVQAAISAIDADNYAREHNAAFFANSARPDVILETPDALTNEERSAILSSWRDAHGGSNKSNGVGILWGGLKATLFGTSPKDMDFVEQRRFSRDEILAMFRVPKPTVGIVEDVNYASALTTNYVYSSRCIKPKMAKITDTLNEFLLPMYGDSNLELCFVDPTPANRVEVVDEYTKGLSAGWLTINEVRAMEGRDPVQGGDVSYVPYASQSIGAPIPKLEEPEDEEKALTVGKEVAQKMSDAMRSLLEDAQKMEAFEKRGITRKTAVEERNAELQKEFDKKMEAFLKEQGKRVAESMKSGEKAASDEYFDKEAERKVLAEYMRSTFENIYKVEGQASLDENNIDFVFDVESTRVQKIVDKNVKLFAKGVTDTTADEISNAISYGIADGQSISEIADSIEEIGAFSPDRALTIAQTETITAQNQSSVEAWKESGVVVKKTWYTAEDERTCPFCEELHGVTVSIEKNFVDRGDSVDGGDSSYDANYRNVGEPALHPNCRCVVLPEIDESKMIAKVEVKEVLDTEIAEIYRKAKDLLDKYEQPNSGA